MSNADNGRRWHTHPIVVTVASAIALAITSVLSAAYGKHLERAERDQQLVLPISANPAFRVSGGWLVDYWEIAAYREAGSGTLPLRVSTANSTATPFSARIELKKSDGSRISGYATAGSRVWAIEGYIDNSALLYIYKDTLNPNSFGSAVVRIGANPDILNGLWAGVSPTFGDNSRLGTSLVGGLVRWRRR
jgi:hypothetical protein